MVPDKISESRNLMTEKPCQGRALQRDTNENRTQRHRPQSQRQRILTEPLNIITCRLHDRKDDAGTADARHGPPDIEGLVLLAPLLSVQVLGQTSADAAHEVLKRFVIIFPVKIQLTPFQLLVYAFNASLNFLGHSLSHSHT